MATIQHNQSKQCASFYKVLVLLIAFVILMQVDGMAQCNSPTGVPNFSCGTGSTTISANSPNAGTFRWYDSPTDGTLLRTSAANVTADNYSTEVINVTTTFYVSFSDEICESPRIPVDASVLPSLSDPPLVFNAARCGKGSVTLTVSSPTNGSNPIPGRFRWYSAPIGGTLLQTSLADQTSNIYNTPSIDVTTTYYVTFMGICSESIRVPIIATVNPVPSIPTAIPGSACGGFVFPIYANTSVVRIFNWYTEASGGSLLPNIRTPTTADSLLLSPLPAATTTYHVAVADAITGCESSRVAVAFTVSASPPTAFTVTDASRCGPASQSSQLSLSANTGNFSITGTFRWYTSPYSRAAFQTATNTSNNTFTSSTISETTVYYVSFTRGGCVSNRSAVTGTINPFSSPPSVAPGSRCATGSTPGPVSLAATSTTSGTFRWYS
ncbi:MAG: hypothetical protein ACKO1F_06155, partial [Flammeovirgaceae bacterium]